VERTGLERRDGITNTLGGEAFGGKEREEGCGHLSSDQGGNVRKKNELGAPYSQWKAKRGGGGKR